VYNTWPTYKLLKQEEANASFLQKDLVGALCQVLAVFLLLSMPESLLFNLKHRGAYHILNSMNLNFMVEMNIVSTNFLNVFYQNQGSKNQK
jgi:ornithine cyclodeaminase/alanine dehydrogenase-like protein (mu-crystallin family)